MSVFDDGATMEAGHTGEGACTGLDRTGMCTIPIHFILVVGGRGIHSAKQMFL